MRYNVFACIGGYLISYDNLPSSLSAHLGVRQLLGDLRIESLPAADARHVANMLERGHAAYLPDHYAARLGLAGLIEQR